MSQKTQQEVAKRISTYLHKTSKHLFVTKEGDLYKVIPFTGADSKEYYAKIFFGKTEPLIKIQEQLSDWSYTNYPTEVFQFIKNGCFSKDTKLTSIPNFKAARALAVKMQNELEKYDGTVPSDIAIKSKISHLLSDAGELKKVA